MHGSIYDRLCEKLFPLKSGVSNSLRESHIAAMVFEHTGLAPSEFARLSTAERIVWLDKTYQKIRPDDSTVTNSNATPPGDTEKTKTPEVKRPSENAFKAWRLRDLLGINKQTELAKKMTEKGVPANQGQVSRWLKQVEEYMAAGGVLPELPKMDKPTAIDPSKIDMGERQDGRTPHQRKRRDADS